MTFTTTIYDKMLTLITRTVRMERSIPDKQKILATLTGDKAAEARAMFAKFLGDINTLKAQIPTIEQDPMAYTYRKYVEIKYDIDAAQTEIQKAETEITRLEEFAAAGAATWRSRAQRTVDATKEVPGVAPLRETIRRSREKLLKLEEEIKSFKQIVELMEKLREDVAEADAWRSNGYTGEVPRIVQMGMDAHDREVRESLVTLPKWKPKKRVAVVEPLYDEIVDDEDWIRRSNEITVETQTSANTMEIICRKVVKDDLPPAPHVNPAYRRATTKKGIRVLFPAVCAI